MAKRHSARSSRSTSPARPSAENFGRCHDDGCPCHSRAAHRATPRFFRQHAHGVRACCRPNRDAVRPPQRERQGHPFSRLSGRDRIEKEVPVKPTNISTLREAPLEVDRATAIATTAAPLLLPHMYVSTSLRTQGLSRQASRMLQPVANTSRQTTARACAASITRQKQPTRQKQLKHY